MPVVMAMAWCCDKTPSTLESNGIVRFGNTENANDHSAHGHVCNEVRDCYPHRSSTDARHGQRLPERPPRFK